MLSFLGGLGSLSLSSARRALGCPRVFLSDSARTPATVWGFPFGPILGVIGCWGAQVFLGGVRETCNGGENNNKTPRDTDMFLEEGTFPDGKTPWGDTILHMKTGPKPPKIEKDGKPLTPFSIFESQQLHDFCALTKHKLQSDTVYHSFG